MGSFLNSSDRPLVMAFSSQTYRVSGFLEAASKLGIDVILASDAKEVPAKLMGDRFIEVDLSDPEGGAQRLIEALAGKHPRAVLALEDAAVRLTAIAAGRLGVSENSVTGIVATTDKAALRRRLYEADVAQPGFLIASNSRDPILKEAEERVGFPCVVKPVELSASTGVIRADSPESLMRAAERVDRVQKALVGRQASLVVEEFLPGKELGVEAVAVGGDLEILRFIDKPDPPSGPYFPERILIVPALLDETEATEVHELVSKAIRALGIVEGPVHAEVRWSESGPRLLEVAARTIGGLCSKAFVFEWDTHKSLEEVVLQRALGDLDAIRCEEGFSGVVMLYPASSGYIRDVEGVRDASAIPYVWGVDITAHRGNYVQPLPDGNRYLGFVFAKAPSYEACVSALEQAETKIRFVIDPAPPSPASPNLESRSLGKKNRSECADTAEDPIAPED